MSAETNLYQMKPFVIVLLLNFLFSCSVNRVDSELPKVQPVDLNELDAGVFSEEEWFVPYYLKHFAEVANSVVDTGLNRGYFSLSVWRGSRNHHTYNAREMEGILSLVWFYCTDRSWNKYYGEKALKKRIEASLEFWCGIQNEDGRFSEYRVGQWSLAPTAFATKFIGRALWLLEKQGPQIDSVIFEKACIALRKAIFAGFTNEDFWQHGRNYTNQYANLWGGALLFLDIRPDQEIENLLKERMAQSMTAFQSPVGFFYEKGGPDWGYNLSTHHSDLQVAWEFADQEIKDMIIKKTKDWYEWFSYNAVKEPDNLCYFLNRSIESRQQKGYFMNVEIEDPAVQRWAPQSEFVPAAHAFEMSKTEYTKTIRDSYQKMLEDYPRVDPLLPGEFNAFSPYAFLHHNMQLWHPDDKQKNSAIAKLPYLKKENFVHFRHDNRSNTSYIFVRRPSYYVTFNSGKIITNQQRYGLGLIWNPKMGTVFQSQSKTNEAAYGTRINGSEEVAEASDLFPEFYYQNRIVKLTEGNTDKGNGKVALTYKIPHGTKNIVFDENRIGIKVQTSGKFTEILPLLVLPDDKISVQKNQISVQNEKGEFSVKLKNASSVESREYETDLYRRSCRVIHVTATNSLEYEITFH